MNNRSVINNTYKFLYAAFGKKVFSKEEQKVKLELVFNLLMEELDEFKQAVEENDVDEIVNALSDLKVVALNATFYINYDKNHIKIDKTKLNDYTTKEFVNDIKDLADNIQLCNFVSESVSDIICACNTYANSNAEIGLKRLKIEDLKTYKSNMTKYCKTVKEAQETVDLYAAGKHPNKMGEKIQATFEETGLAKFKYKIISPQNKILKGKNFVDVDGIKLTWWDKLKLL